MARDFPQCSGPIRSIFFSALGNTTSIMSGTSGVGFSSVQTQPEFQFPANPPQSTNCIEPPKCKSPKRPLIHKCSGNGPRILMLSILPLSGISNFLRYSQPSRTTLFLGDCNTAFSFKMTRSEYLNVKNIWRTGSRFLSFDGHASN